MMQLHLAPDLNPQGRSLLTNIRVVPIFGPH